MTRPGRERSEQKWWGVLPRFDPDEGNVVAEPPGEGYGFWAGAPSAVYDPETGRFYCYYRARWPLGTGAAGCVASWPAPIRLRPRLPGRRYGRRPESNSAPVPSSAPR